MCVCAPSRYTRPPVEFAQQRRVVLFIREELLRGACTSLRKAAPEDFFGVRVVRKTGRHAEGHACAGDDGFFRAERSAMR